MASLVVAVLAILTILMSPPWMFLAVLDDRELLADAPQPGLMIVERHYKETQGEYMRPETRRY